MSLSHKIDFAVIFAVKNANPNGDPLNGNRPRLTFDNLGEVSDVALKRKLRDRLLEGGHAIFVQSNDRNNDGATSLKDRSDKTLGSKLTSEELAQKACAQWLDVRAFGQLFAWKGTKGAGDGVSVAIRGPVTFQSAFSIAPVDISSIQITKSVNTEGDSEKKGSDTMGMKHRVDHGIYLFYGSMNPQLAQRTHFSDEDAQLIKQTLPRLFENDESTARPAGSMEVRKVLWWQHNCAAGQYSSAKVHRSLSVQHDGSYTLTNLPGLTPEELDGY
ncbi:CRISPR-associated protein, Csd2 family [Magnetococcus marinus MC-1]|uniref:CRISPR-associated protein, Csd2 family n=1 Tax=Magnetococcus marinus (strain ATCC BAA-1437 / JCM 17883 / MC-1) TaxID=156889 RepID=A0LDG4_MAGMM|nr:type I-C CRISPR-associated protein Cas7/Csd2 [Magnetococcus marinus]ABK46007.1 CRISPR-associated protein, Csd2 family [Magnetococcus marinus MC-1]